MYPHNRFPYSIDYLKASHLPFPFYMVAIWNIDKFADASLSSWNSVDYAQTTEKIIFNPSVKAGVSTSVSLAQRMFAL